MFRFSLHRTATMRAPAYTFVYPGLRREGVRG
jgi:hypothetical protein